MPLDFWMVGLIVLLTVIALIYVRGLEELP
jgi:hypothetical protein